MRPCRDTFINGDKVYYLRDGKWKGPGWVIGQYNVVVFVRHGGTYVRAHSSRLLRYNESSIQNNNVGLHHELPTSSSSNGDKTDCTVVIAKR